MKKRKKNVFENVITFHLAWMIPISIPCVLFYGFLYNYLFGGIFRLSFVSIFTGFYLATIILILKIISVKKIALWFDDYYLYIRKGENITQKYLKEDIEGIYSYDYESISPRLQNSKINIQLYLKNKKRIYLYDLEYRKKYKIEKGNQLRKFLITIQQELGFSKLKRKRFQNVYWYSTKINNIQ